jgi:hypothetical protein
MIWSLDQTLIWIATGKIDAVEQVGQQKGKLWLDYALDGCDKPLDSLTHDQPPKPDAEAVVKLADGVEWSRENYGTSPCRRCHF